MSVDEPIENPVTELWNIYEALKEVESCYPCQKCLSCAEGITELRERLGWAIKCLRRAPAELGRVGGQKGGASKSEAKREAARANGAKGGRPKKHPPCPYCGRLHIPNPDRPTHVFSDGYGGEFEVCSRHQCERLANGAVLNVGQRKPDGVCCDCLLAKSKEKPSVS